MTGGQPVYIALDVGDARIGVALSRSGVLAEPYVTVERKGRRQVLDAIEAIVTETAATDCVLGLPLLEGGQEGAQAEKTRAFARSLQRRLPALRLHFFDERYTSSDAREIAANRGQRSPSRALIDRLAASVILQDFLDAGGTEGKDQHEKKKREPDAPS